MSDPYGGNGYGSEREISLGDMLEKIGGAYGYPQSRFGRYLNIP